MRLVTNSTVTDLEAEASALVVWHGRNIYSDFLMKNRRRPDLSEAETIGRLMGTRVRASDGSMRPLDFKYVYFWNRQGRKGQRCAVTARAKVMNSIRVEFEDGFIMITSGNSIRRAK